MGGKFFVVGGDAAEGFEASEEIFDVVAFAIEVLVKGRFFGSAIAYGYDGGAAELVHISTDGIAVVALVHDRVGLGFEVGAQERFTLIVVGDIGAGEQEAQRIAQGVTGQMDFRREAGLGASHRLSELTARWTGGVLMYAHRSTVDHQVLVIRLISHIAKQALPQPRERPAAKARIHARPRAKLPG